MRPGRHDRRLQDRQTSVGIAFHPEVDGLELDGWMEQAGSTMESVWGRSPPDLRKEAAEQLPAHEERGRELFRRFARVVLESSAQ